MALFGQDYINGSPSLQILLLSVLPATLTTGINILIYSYGNYRQVLIIGLASSIPRTILYFALVPIYGSNGSAISFTIGSIIGSIACIVICRKIGMLIFWKDSYLHVHDTNCARICLKSFCSELHYRHRSCSCHFLCIIIKITSFKQAGRSRFVWDITSTDFNTSNQCIE